jgi:nitrite reductase/ring-hydroxylating ferredoxin subunit
MSFRPALTLSELPAGTARRVHLDGVDLAVVHTGGEVFAVGDQCTHADVSLAEGEVDGGTLECWLHGSRFDLRTGAPIGLPATTPVPVYPVKVEGSGAAAVILVDVPTKEPRTP